MFTLALAGMIASFSCISVSAHHHRAHAHSRTSRIEHEEKCQASCYLHSDLEHCHFWCILLAGASQRPVQIHGDKETEFVSSMKPQITLQSLWFQNRWMRAMNMACHASWPIIWPNPNQKSYSSFKFKAPKSSCSKCIHKLCKPVPIYKFKSVLILQK